MKTMKKNIVLKLLTGVVTTTITATGIAVPMMVGSGQNREDISVIADEDIQVAEMVAGTEIISDETNIVEDVTIVEDDNDAEDVAVAEDKTIVEDKVDVEGDADAEEDESTNIESGQSAQPASTPEQPPQSTPTSEQPAQSTPKQPAQLASTPTPEQPARPTSEQPAQPTSAPKQPAQPASTPTPEQPAQPTPEPVHEHNWIAHNSQRWVSKIVTAVDEPERYEEYSIYRMYWYDTGTWEETRDPDRFCEWSYSENGQLYPFFHLEKSEDSPLFLGYDELGHATYLGDHSIRSGYDFIPAVTHEEDQGYYETYVDYRYCECGSVK